MCASRDERSRRFADRATFLRLRQGDVDLGNRRLYIRQGKTKAARRTLTLTVESMHILAHRLSKGSEWVFPSPKRPGKRCARE